MLPVYNNIESIETVYTYEGWLKKYNRRETKYLYYMKQRLSGVIMATIGIVMPVVLDGDITFSLVSLPLGIFLLFTKEKVMTF